MVQRTFCDRCARRLSDGPESNPITVAVDGNVYYEGHLCEAHWKELMEILESYFKRQSREENQDMSFKYKFTLEDWEQFWKALQESQEKKLIDFLKEVHEDRRIELEKRHFRRILNF